MKQFHLIRIPEWVHVTFISITLAIVTTWQYWTQPGYIYLAEEFEVFTASQFLGVSYPLWNEELGRFPSSDAFKLYYYLLLYAVGELFGYKALQGLALALPTSLSFISAYALTRYLTRNPLASLTAGFIYAVNPWVATNPKHLVMRLEYALFPLLFLLLIKYLDTRLGKYIVYTALILGAVYTIRSWTLFLLYSLIILSIHALIRRDLKPLLFLTTHPIALLLATPRVMPSVYYALNVPQYTLLTFTPKTITALEYLTTYIYSYLGAHFSLTYTDGTHYLFGIVTSVTIALTLMGRDAKLRYFVALYVIGFFLSTYPIESGISLADRLLRAGYWNAMIAPLAVALATGYLVNQRYGKYAAPVIIIAAAISAWPLFTGDMTGYWRPAPPPPDYLEAKKLLEDTEFLVMWLPYIGDFRAVWSAQTGPTEVSAPTGHVEVRGIGAPAVEWRAYYPLHYFNPIEAMCYLQPFDVYRGNLSHIYSLMGIRYVGIVYDRQWPEYAQRCGITNERLIALVEKLTTQENMKVVLKGRHLAVLEVEDAAACAVRRPLFCLCDLPELARLLSLFSRHNAPAVILPQPGLNITHILTHSYVYAQNATELLLYASSHLPASRIIPLFFTIPGGDPQKTWARAPLAAYGVSPDFLNYLYRKGVRKWSWQSDYGYGVVYTESAEKLSLDVETEEESLLAIRLLKCPVCGSVEVHVDNIRIKIDAQDNATSFTWLLITTLMPGKHRVELKPHGLAVINVIAIIPRKNIEKAGALVANARGIDQLLNKTEPPGVATCRKTSPTRWMLEVDVAEQPAVVVLPIPHDPLWRIGGEKAVAIYGVVAGFYIDAGRHEATYDPEHLIPATVAATTIALLLPLAYYKRKT